MTYSIEEARRLRAIIEKQMQGADDVTALEAVTLYPHWQTGVAYKPGYRLQYNGVLYYVQEPGHTSAAEWPPDLTPALYAKVLIPDPDVIPAWEQPIPPNGYEYGDKVKHNGKTWESRYNGINTWEPGVIGTEALWVEVTE